MRRFALVLLLALLLMPSISFGQAARQAPAKISFDFVDADVRNVLRIFAEIAKKNMVIGDDVKGKITIKLEELSYDEALDVVLKNNELAKIDEDNVVRIVTAKKLSSERDREAKERLDFLKEKEARQRLEEDLVTETVFINYADPTEVEKMIRGETSEVAVGAAAGGTSSPTAGPVVVQRGRGLLSPSGVVTLVKWNSALIIRDTKDSVERIVKLIREHDVPPQQVQIEARIVQANTTFSRDLGVEWSGSYNNTIGGRQSGVSADVTPGRPTTTGSGAIAFFIGSAADSFQLSATLSAMENQGKGKVISNPKVITADNRPAKITQGQQIPYLNTTSTAGATVEFKDAVLELEVTPHIAKDGNIRLTIKAKKDQVDLAAFPTNPPIDKREATTELLVRDGQTAVIGGIYEITQQSNDSGVPFLRHIPLLGWLFKRETKTDNKTELLIFVTPTIIKNLYTEKRDR